MYLVSIYFDEKTDKIIQNHVTQVAEKTGNKFMIDGKVPPHITISAFETKQEEKVIEKINDAVKDMHRGTVQWVSVGAFFPYVLYLTPVLNEYLHGLSEKVYESVKDVKETNISLYYRPFQWIPHTTIGKKLLKEEMDIAFQTLQNSFGRFSGRVTKVGLAKTNPYEDIIHWELK